MMLKNKLEFPYPTILSETIYYKKSTINFRTVIEVNSDNIKFTYIFTINSPFIDYLLSEKICSAYLIIDSEYSMYHEIVPVTTFNQNVGLTLQVSNLQNKLTITPVISLNANFSNFTSDEFKDSTISYNASKYDIIGFIEPLEFYLDNYNSIFPSLANVITIREFTSSSKNVTYKLEDELIIIFVHDMKSYEMLQEVNMTNKFTHTLYQSLVLPVLIAALLNLRHPAYENYRWNRLLQNKLIQKNIKIPTTYKQAYDVAQTLLEHPAINTIKELHKIGSEDE